MNRRKSAQSKGKDGRVTMFKHDTTHRQHNRGWHLISRCTITQVLHAQVGSDHDAV